MHIMYFGHICFMSFFFNDPMSFIGSPYRTILRMCLQDCVYLASIYTHTQMHTHTQTHMREGCSWEEAED